MAAGEGGRGGVGFWVGAVAGSALVAFGLRGLLENEPRGASSALRWLVGSALVLDLLVIPLAAAIGWGLHRVLPAWTWPVVRAALGISAVLIVFALPLVLDQGGTPGNATVRPRDYEQGLLVALAWTWGIAAAWLVVLRVRRRTPALR
jgi:hypothetical protein